MRVSSAKAKGRRFQQQIVASIKEVFTHLTANDVVSVSMGTNGEDITLSPLAEKCFPYSVECKNTEKLTLTAALAQGRANALRGKTPILAIRRNRQIPYAVVPEATMTRLLTCCEDEWNLHVVADFNLERLNIWTAIEAQSENWGKSSTGRKKRSSKAEKAEKACSPPRQLKLCEMLGQPSTVRSPLQSDKRRAPALRLSSKIERGNTYVVCLWSDFMQLVRMEFDYRSVDEHVPQDEREDARSRSPQTVLHVLEDLRSNIEGTIERVRSTNVNATGNPTLARVVSSLTDELQRVGRNNNDE